MRLCEPKMTSGELTEMAGTLYKKQSSSVIHSAHRQSKRTSTLWRVLVNGVLEAVDTVSTEVAGAVSQGTPVAEPTIQFNEFILTTFDHVTYSRSNARWPSFRLSRLQNFPGSICSLSLRCSLSYSHVGGYFELAMDGMKIFVGK